MKKTLTMTLALAMLLLCAACGADSTAVTGDTTNALTQTAQQEEADQTQAETAQSTDTITDNRTSAETTTTTAEAKALKESAKAKLAQAEAAQAETAQTEPTQAETAQAETARTEPTQAETTPDIGAEQPTSVDRSQFEIREFAYVTMFDDTQYFVAVKNNSSQTVGISANAIAYDAGGAMIGAADMSIDVIGPGQESIGYFYFSGVTGIASVVYEPQFDLDPHYTDVLAGLTTQTALNPANVIVSVTNNGTQAAQFVEAYVLFFDAAGTVVDYSSAYVTDDDCELKPGATLTVQLDCYEAYDHAEVFLTGRSEYIWSW